MTEPLAPDLLDALSQLDTCSVTNAIETFELRLRNEGFMDSTVRCIFPRKHSMVGYAVTVKIRCSSPPTGDHHYYDSSKWWDHILSVPKPRIVVIEDVDSRPGTGSFLGEVHCNILQGLGCIGAVTNGAVRDLPELEHLPFHLFAGHVGVSHAYSHIVSFGGPVSVAGLNVLPGDLLHGDRHGVVSIPPVIAYEIPAIAQLLRRRECEIIDACQHHDFSVQRLRAVIERNSNPS